MRRKDNVMSVKQNQSSMKQNQSRMMERSAHGRSMGLNPNLTMQDEYVQNLLKQIHFMNLQVGLLKEKQAASDGNALWGVVNRGGEPLVRNIVDSNKKYQEMKKTTTNHLHTLQFETILLTAEQDALAKVGSLLEANASHLDTAKTMHLVALHPLSAKLQEGIAKHRNSLTILANNKQLLLSTNVLLKTQLNAISSEAAKETALQQFETATITNEEIIQQQMENNCIQHIASFNAKIKQLKAKIETNEDYVKANELQQNIRDNISKMKKDIAVLDFEMLQTCDGIRLVEQEKDKQIIQRKKLTEQYENLKTMLKEIQNMNAVRKKKETQIRKSASLQIQRGVGQTKKQQKHLQQIRRKLSKSQQSERSLVVQTSNLERELIKLKERHKMMSEALTQSAADIESQQRMLNVLRSENRKQTEQEQRAAEAQIQAALARNTQHKEVVCLRQQKETLVQKLNLKETVGLAKLQQLQKVVQKNRDVNDTVVVLLEKWEEVKLFSKI